MNAISANELATLHGIAREAGMAILQVYGTDFTSQSKQDDSPVTEADLIADRIIRRRLEVEFPGIFILSEESVTGRALARYDSFFLVDPLDGTKEFIKRNGEFTVNIALVANGRAIAGAVFAPALDLMYYAALGMGAWKESASGRERLLVQSWCGAKPLRIIGSRSHPCDNLAAWLADLPCQFEFVPAGSSLKFCRIAEGAADIYPRFQPTSQWDTAAAQCILEAAGGAVKSVAGMALMYGLDQPLLNPAFFASVPGSEHLILRRPAYLDPSDQAMSVMKSIP